MRPSEAALRSNRAILDKLHNLDSGGDTMKDIIEDAQRRAEDEAEADDDAERGPFAGLAHLPTFGEALELLAQEAMARAGGNQTLAARLLGITQPALSKRLKRWRR